MNPKVAIVILNWNGRKFLEQFLPSITRSSYSNWELVVVDNASTDDSIKFLATHYPDTRIVQNNLNEGFAGGYNLGLKQVKAPYYVLLNSDVEVTTDWLQPMVDLLENDLSIAACQPSLLQFADKSRYEYAGAAGGWLDVLGYPFTRGRVFDYCETVVGQYQEEIPIFWASGAALFIRSKVYWELNGLDEHFFAHQEEIDLCWRIQWAGYKIYSCPNSIVYHVGGGTLPKGNSRKTYLNFRNNLTMLGKNLSWKELLLIIPIRFLMDALFAWKSLLKGDSGSYLAVAKAHFAFLGWLLTRKDKRWFPKKLNRNWDGYYKGSVVWKYHLEKKNRFSEIVKNIR